MSVVFLLPSGMRLLRIEEGDSEAPLRLAVKTISRCASCPICQRKSRRVHSHYWRMLEDLPCSGMAVHLRVQARRFFCGNHQCPRRIVAERLELDSAHAQRTDRLKQAQTSVGQAVGSRPGVRLAAKLSIATSATTLLRMERADPPPSAPHHAF